MTVDMEVGDATLASEVADVRLDRVTKRFGDTVAVDDVRLVALANAVFQRRTSP
jgi:hypothetical protein